MNKSRTKTVAIPKDIMAELDQMEDRTQQGRIIKFSPEQDAILMHLMDRKSYVEVYAWWKKKYGCGSKSSLSARYRLLKEQANGVVI